MGQVQSLKLLSLGLCNPMEDNSKDRRCGESAAAQSPREETEPQELLVSGSLDNTIKLWDIESGKVERTLFGHIEGVWAVTCDKMRLVSGSHDRTIKVRKSFLKKPSPLDPDFNTIFNRFGAAMRVDV
jgi:F-box/WD-40 domain protein MET30